MSDQPEPDAGVRVEHPEHPLARSFAHAYARAYANAYARANPHANAHTRARAYANAHTRAYSDARAAANPLPREVPAAERSSLYAEQPVRERGGLDTTD